MSKLTREIAQLEANIELENEYIKMQHILLNHQVSHSKILPYTMAGALIIGFIFARKKSILQLVRSLVGISVPAKKFYDRFKFILPLF